MLSWIMVKEIGPPGCFVDSGDGYCTEENCRPGSNLPKRCLWSHQRRDPSPLALSSNISRQDNWAGRVSWKNGR